MEEKFDAVVVGAGLAGCSAAIKLASGGMQVVLIERGLYPGSKNLSGGVLYGRILEELIPEYWKEAPIERFITNHVVTFLTDEASLSIDFKAREFAEPPYNGVSILRAKFDRWMGEKAEEAGVMLVPGTRVDRLIKREERVVGIVAGEDEIFANVIIAADGANSFLAQEAGMRDRIETRHLAVGVKELIGLPRETIEERFNLNSDEGTAYSIVGAVTKGVPGGGFLYTNKDSISIGIVMHLDELIHTGIKPAEVIESFLAHPMIHPLVRGGRLLEYGAHIIPEGGFEMMPRLTMDGMLLAGDAAGLTINNGLSVRGMDLAIGSGFAAAETVLEAKAKEDFSAQALSPYQRKMEETFVLRDMKTFAGAPQFMKCPRIYEAYPEMLTRVMTAIYRQDAKPKRHLINQVTRVIKQSGFSLGDLARDGWNGVRWL
jgi:electron transfer flavoprotein-quinone oxidoreductase